MITCAVGIWWVCTMAHEGSGLSRERVDLSGVWEIRPDEKDVGLSERWFDPQTGGPWQSTSVPSAWEDTLGFQFDTVGWYRKQFPTPAFRQSDHLLVHFQAVATEATVWVNGQKVGSHLGPWTPFTLDCTQMATPGATTTLVARVDEKVGHNTQGFLPIVAPHFGGIWQPVTLHVVGPSWIDEERVRIDSSQIEGQEATLKVSAPLQGRLSGEDMIEFILRRGTRLVSRSGPLIARTSPISWTWTGCVDPWHSGRPNLYRLEITLSSTAGHRTDRVHLSCGFRKAEARERVVTLNGQPIVAQGVLNWGVYPPSVAPCPSPQAFEEELKVLQDCGFNLVKFCLWMPPRELLDVVDERGMLAWIEYPTWHARWDQAHADELTREYEEMSDLDGNHPSVIFRSITCETGPSADLEVLTSIYQLLKARCPGTLVEDDSSWIAWNRIHDFWDDHPYGNNRAWRSALQGLQSHREEHGMKPLLLGEAIAADTWADSRQLTDEASEGSVWWQPNWLQDQLRFEKDLEERFGEPGFSPVQDLRATALRTAMQMRRWQIQTLREALPDAGYVVSTLRDVRLCSMGLFEALGAPKWPSNAWSWHGPIMLGLRTEADQRGFLADGFGKVTVTPSLRASQQGLLGSVKRIRWCDEGGREVAPAWTPRARSCDPSLAVEGPPILWERTAPVEKPSLSLLKARLTESHRKDRDLEWAFWALPAPAPLSEGWAFYGAEGQGRPEGLEEVFPNLEVIPPGQGIPSSTRCVLTRVLTEEILDHLERGGVVLHCPSPLKGSLKMDRIWFLRGTAWSPPQPKAFFDRVPRDMLPDLQLFELEGEGVVRGERIWDQVDPLLAFIETHDLDRVRPNLLLFQTGVGAGRLMVSCLRHPGGRSRNYAGLWLARELARYAEEGPPPSRRLSQETVQILRRCLRTDTFTVESPWRFRIDPHSVGLDEGWATESYDDREWMALKARSREENEIWDAYDGWGWYRQGLDIPNRWQGERVLLVFDSVDDMYELFVNGEKAGSYGRMDRSESSFLKRTWVDVTRFLRFGESNHFVVHVYDWVGSGGLNGAVWFTTGPPEEGSDLIRMTPSS